MQRHKGTQTEASAIKAYNDQSPGDNETGPSCTSCGANLTATPSGGVSDEEGCPENIQHIERSRYHYPYLNLVAHNKSKNRARHLIAIMDTGADTSVMVEHAAGRLGLEIDTTERPFLEALAGDRTIQALGKVELHFSIEEQGKSYVATFFVLENSALPQTRDVLLSESFVCRENLLVYRTPYKVRAIKAFSSYCEAVASLGSAAQDPKATTAPTGRAIGWRIRPISSAQNVMDGVAIVADHSEDKHDAS